MNPKIFISYRRQDTTAFAGRLYDRLSARYGRASVFMDIDTIPFGGDFREHIKEAVIQCHALLALIGDRWARLSPNGEHPLDDAADFVRMEIESALHQGIPVVPLLIGRVSMPAATELPSSLADLAYRHALHIDPGRDFHHHIDRLIQGLDVLLGESDTPAASPQAIAGDWSVHDKAMLDFFYPCFDRAAFQIPFLAEVPKEMIEAIEDTIMALGAGIRKTRSGHVVDRGRPKAEFESQGLRHYFDVISGHLQDVKTAYEVASSTEQLDVRSGVIIANDPAVPAIIDGKRNLVVKALNEVYARLGRSAFPLIPQNGQDKFDLFDKLRHQFLKELE